MTFLNLGIGRKYAATADIRIVTDEADVPSCLCPIIRVVYSACFIKVSPESNSMSRL